jgi:hypothetical protein
MADGATEWDTQLASGEGGGTEGKKGDSDDVADAARH